MNLRNASTQLRRFEDVFSKATFLRHVLHHQYMPQKALKKIMK